MFKQEPKLCIDGKVHDFEKCVKVDVDYDSFYGRKESEYKYEYMICKKCGKVIEP